MLRRASTEAAGRATVPEFGSRKCVAVLGAAAPCTAKATSGATVAEGGTLAGLAVDTAATVCRNIAASTDARARAEFRQTAGAAVTISSAAVPTGGTTVAEPRAGQILPEPAGPQ
ncbi:hypothetical protein DL767_006441 [Monosporascus sp. MG133]|nr:hypothetical protein DL767_006441 [Monosporascus sp. MG133]